MKKIFVMLVVLVGFGISSNAQVKSNDVAVLTSLSEQSVQIANAETTDVSKTETNSSGCNAKVYSDYDSYCGSHKIKYYNTCNKRLYVKIRYTTFPNEGYSGRTESHTWSGYLSANYSNATLIDCNKTINVRLDDVDYGDWEE